MLAGALILTLSACASAPVLVPATTPVDVAPDALAIADGRYRDAAVVWGGRIVEVRNREQATEVVIDAYPLDAGQRPLIKKDRQGRFVAVLPGYVESHDMPPGRFLSVSGTLGESVMEATEQGERRCPLVLVSATHLWPPGYPESAPQMHFSIGVSGGIR